MSQSKPRADKDTRASLKYQVGDIWYAYQDTRDLEIVYLVTKIDIEKEYNWHVADNVYYQVSLMTLAGRVFYSSFGVIEGPKENGSSFFDKNSVKLVSIKSDTTK